MTVEAPTGERRSSPVRARPALGIGTLRSALPFVVIAVVSMWVIPDLVGGFWLTGFIAGICAIPVFQLLGILSDRMGVMALCGLEFAGVGAYVVGYCDVHHIAGGFCIWLIIGGLAAVPFGLLIGLPALRLRGINLAITTFAFAFAVDGLFGLIQFPGQAAGLTVARPGGFGGDPSYFRFCVLVVFILFIGIWLIDRSRLGPSWMEIRYSERGAAAHGTNLVSSKLLAFAVAAFLGGISGGLTAGQLGTLTNTQFTAQGSVTYFALAMLFGVRFWDTAMMAGVTIALFSSALTKVGLNPDYTTLVFGVGALAMMSGGKGQQTQAEMMRAQQAAKKAKKRLAQGIGLRESRKHAHGEAPVPTSWANAQGAISGAGDVLEIHDMTVRFGAVTAVDGVSLSLPRGSVVALLGPNGAGKSTLVNAATGFTRYTGSVVLNGRQLDGLAPHRRADLGLRRSFQQLRVPPWLTVGQFVSLAAGRRVSTAEAREILDWFECPDPITPIQTLDVGTRRAVEVAGLIAGRPEVVLLDEPAAGQNATESVVLAKRLSDIPRLTGTTVLLIEHDIDLVRAACESLVVMDFGAVIASGAPEAVLSDPRVTEAYLGAMV